MKNLQIKAEIVAKQSKKCIMNRTANNEMN